MSFSKSRHFLHKVFEAGLLAKAVESFISTLGDKPSNVEIKDYLLLLDGSRAINTLSTPAALATICNISGHHIDVSAWTSSREYRSFEITIDRGLIEVRVNSETPDKMQLILDLLTTVLVL